MKHLRVTLEVCGAAVLFAAFVTGSRPSVAQVSKEAQALRPAVSYAQTTPPMK